MRLVRVGQTLVVALAASALVSGCAPAGLSATHATPAASTTHTPAASTVASPASPAAPSTTPADSSSPSPAAPSVSGTPSDPQPQPGVAEDPPTKRPELGPRDLVPGTNHNLAADEAGYVYPAAKVNAWLTGKERRPDKKLVFLTFDDGPNPHTSHVILDALKKGGAHATFFVVGQVIDSAPDMLRREIAEGHSVSLHSHDHDYSRLYPGRKADTSAIMHEYHQVLGEVRSVLGPDYNTESWRYPGGHMSWDKLAKADKQLAAQGVSWIDWNSDTRDSAPVSERPTKVSQIVHNATQQIREGYHMIVVLGHDTPEKKITSQSVGAMIKAFKKAGYSFATIA